MKTLSRLSAREVESLNRAPIDEVLYRLEKRGVNRVGVRSRSANGFGRMLGHVRLKNPGVPGMIDIIDQPIYDSVSFAAGAAMAATKLFQTPQGQGGKTLAQTNMTSAGQLPAPWSLDVTAVKVYIANNTVPADLQNLQSNVSLTFYVGIKWFLQCPLVNLPAAMGAFNTYASQIGTAAAGDRPYFSTSNGWPDTHAAYTLTKVIPIGIEENFNVTLVPETGFNFAAAAGTTYGAGTTIQVYLDGVLTRQVQ